jgi:hypothetical protein
MFDPLGHGFRCLSRERKLSPAFVQHGYAAACPSNWRANRALVISALTWPGNEHTNCTVWRYFGRMAGIV